ncbi:MAG TPA: hypothetical protein VLW50_32090 [Streptosporangiaceae bacterium]|nr:hypothetical protein [Streptosporangiaceae bacterium]
MTHRVLGISVILILCSCPSPRPGSEPSPASARLACASRIALTGGFAEVNLGRSGATRFVRARPEGGEDVIDVTASDSAVSAQAFSASPSVPVGGAASSGAVFVAGHIREACSR